MLKTSDLKNFFFPYNPPPPRQSHPGCPTRESLISVHFSSVSAPFGLRFGSFRLRFGSVSGPFQGVGWVRGGVGERGLCKGKETFVLKTLCRRATPEGPARQIDVSRQKLSPHCLEAIFDSQLPSPKLSPRMPPKLSLPHKRGLFILFQN